MKTRRYAVLAMGMIIVTGGILAWHFERGLEGRAGRISALTTAISIARDRSDRLRARLAQAERLQARSRAELAKAHAVAKGKGDAGKDWLERLSSDPELQNRYLAYQRSKFAMKYGALFQALALTPDQISKCEDNLISRMGIEMDLENTLRAQGLTWSDPAAQKLQTELMASYNADQKELLGEDGFSQLNAYDQDFHWKTMATDFAGAATLAGVPLTSAQVQQLTTLAVQASKASGAAQQAGVEAAYWASMDSQAASFLTPAQLDLMKTGEFIGPFGEGSRFQGQLNTLITLGDQADAGATLLSNAAGR
jgi:hypothetical protein